MKNFNEANEAFANKFEELKQQFVNPIDVTDQFDPADIEANKGISIVACLPWMFWAPLLVNKESAYGKFYANQGLITIILKLISGLLGELLGLFPYEVGDLLGGVGKAIFGLASSAAFIFTIINAAQGKAKPIPVLGKKIKIIK